MDLVGLLVVVQGTPDSVMCVDEMVVFVSQHTEEYFEGEVGVMMHGAETHHKGGNASPSCV